MLRDPDKRAAYDQSGPGFSQRPAVSPAARLVAAVRTIAAASDSRTSMASAIFSPVCSAARRDRRRRSATGGGCGPSGRHRGGGLRRHQTPRHAQRECAPAPGRRANTGRRQRGPVAAHRHRRPRLADFSNQTASAPSLRGVGQGRADRIALGAVGGGPGRQGGGAHARRHGGADRAGRRAIGSEAEACAGGDFRAIRAATRSSSSSW